MPDWDVAAEAPAAPRRKLTADDLLPKLTGLGYSASGAAGILKNIERESGFDPESLGDGRTSLGLFQHHAERKTALEAFAKEQNKPASDPDVQIAFFDREMRDQYPKLRARLAAEDVKPEDAESLFRTIYERPKAAAAAGGTGGSDWAPVSTSKFKFSDYALRQYADQPNTDLVWMTPDEYLTMSPPLKGSPGEKRQANSLRRSLDSGDAVEQIPTLDVTIDPTGAKVSGQDGRHRALAAKEQGIERIPVAIRRTGPNADKRPGEIEGMEGGALLPYDFEGFTPPEAPPGMAESLVKGVGAGFGKTVLAGQELVGKGLSGVGMTEAGKWLTDDARSGIARLQHDTAAARLAHPIIEGGAEILGGSALPGGAAAKLGGGALRMGATAGAIGGALEPASGDGLDYAATKAGQVAVGAGVGAVVGKGVQLVAKAAGDAVAPIVDWIRGIKGPNVAKDAASRQIIDRIQQDVAAGGPTAQHMIDLLTEVPGKPLTIADVAGPNLAGLAGRVARNPGESKAIISDFMAQRDLDAGLRIADDINSMVGGGSAHDAGQALSRARSTAAAPLYDAAFAQPVTMAQVRPLQRVIGDPIGQDALQKGMRVIELEDLAAGRLFNPERYGVVRSEQTGNWIIDPDIARGARTPSVRLLDAVKRGFDEIVEGFRDPTSGRLNLNQYGRAVNQVRAMYVGRMRSSLPGYAEALDSWGGPSQSLTALRDGKNFLRRTPEEIAQRVADFSPSDREFYKLGAADTLRRDVARTGAAGDEARKIVGNNYVRQQLRPLFDSDAQYQRFIDSVGAESRMFRTGTKMLSGSQTAERLAEDTSPAGQAFDSASHAAIKAAHGNWLGAVRNTIDAVKFMRLARNPEVMRDMARILTDTAPPGGGPSAGVRLLQQVGSGLPATRNLLSQGQQNALSLMLAAPSAQTLQLPGNQR